MHRKTVFLDLRQGASAVYRVTTESSVYILGFHEERGRRFVVVRGLPGTDREHVVIRDSDPRIGRASMFELAPQDWVGQIMEVATMMSSAVTEVAIETDGAVIASVGGDAPTARVAWARPGPGAAPVAWSPQPAPQPARAPGAPAGKAGLGRGTNPAIPEAAARGVGYQVVTGQPAQPVSARPAEPEIPYPERHVQYAESAAALLRSIARRDRLFEHVAHDRDLQQRLIRSLDDCADLLEQIRRRNRR
jgi:hypothetical protein